MIAIRGAITVNENTKSDILESTKILLMSIIEENDLTNDDIISIYFTATKDLTKLYPAVAAREIGLTDCSLLCGQEMYVEDSLKMCIRALLHVASKCCQKDAKHVYLREAKSLRPDIIK
jgi:monofunctional chorismate mutase